MAITLRREIATRATAIAAATALAVLFAGMAGAQKQQQQKKTP